MQRSTKAIIISVLNLLFIGTASIATFALTHRTNDDIASQPTVSAAQSVSQPPTRAELLKLVNEQRAKVGVAPLVEDVRLDTSAQRKAGDMQTYNYFGHVSPNDGKHGYEYINDVGITCTTDSENLSWNTDRSTITSRAAVTWWMNSKPHHDTMLDPEYTLTGFGVVNDAVVEHFCQQ